MNIVKGMILAPIMIVWIWIVGNVLIGFYVPLFWLVLKGIFTGDFTYHGDA